jgi:hypothetical protein
MIAMLFIVCAATIIGWTLWGEPATDEWDPDTSQPVTPTNQPTIKH